MLNDIQRVVLRSLHIRYLLLRGFFLTVTVHTMIGKLPLGLNQLKLNAIKKNDSHEIFIQILASIIISILSLRKKYWLD